MAKRLPYSVTTESGEHFDVSFPLHPETASPMRVAQMVSAVLATLDQEVRLDARTSNGDVLQAMAMALAVRASMIAAPNEITDRLAHELVSASLAAMADAPRTHRQVGHA
jgi:hypothetical protein